MKTKPIPRIAWLAALLSFPPAQAFAQQPVDAPPAESHSKGGPQQEGPRDLLLRYEMFSVSPDLAVLMLRDQSGDRTFYESLIGKLEGGEVKQEDLTLVRMPSGQKARTVSCREIIYPTEYSRSRITTAAATPGEEPSLKASAPEVVIPALPTSFVSRQAGIVIEMEAATDVNHSQVELRFVSERVVQAGRIKWGQGTSETQLPKFETQKLDGSVSFPMGSPFFLGTMNPREGSEVTPDRVWFAFVTANSNAK